MTFKAKNIIDRAQALLQSLRDIIDGQSAETN